MLPASRPPPRTGPRRLLLLCALVVSIPAFYLVLAGPNALHRTFGRLLYGLMAGLAAADIAMLASAHRLVQGTRWKAMTLDLVLVAGAIASASASISSSAPPWSHTEWLLRLGFTTLVFMRLSQLLLRWLRRGHMLQILAIAFGMLAIAGGGFYWLEPNVASYADGVWLAFTTAATVGYGDLIPSTPAARIFAGFIVLLGYAVFSVATAGIAALFIGEEEKHIEAALHADIRLLREEIAALRAAISERQP